MTPKPDRIFRILALIGLLLATQLVRAVDYDQGLVWEVRRDGAVKAYIMGTIHSEDERLLKVLDKVQPYVLDCTVLALELKLDQEMAVTLQQKMLLTDGRNLEQIVGADFYRELAVLAQAHGIPRSSLRLLKPWAVFVALSTPPSASGMFLDRRLYMLAKARDKQLAGLESVEEQLAVFDNLSESEQIDLLRDTVKHYDEMAPAYEKMLVAYLQRDLARIVSLNEQLMDKGDRALSHKLMEQLLDVRNRRMVERMIPLWQDERVFIGIGAMHLVGEQGILRLLENRGFSLKRIY